MATSSMPSALGVMRSGIKPAFESSGALGRTTCRPITSMTASPTSAARIVNQMGIRIATFLPCVKRHQSNAGSTPIPASAAAVTASGRRPLSFTVYRRWGKIVSYLPALIRSFKDHPTLTEPNGATEFQNIGNAQANEDGLIECAVLPLRGIVIYPDVVSPVFIGTDQALAAVE